MGNPAFNLPSSDMRPANDTFGDPNAFAQFQNAQDGLSSALSRLLVTVEPNLKEECRKLWQEAQELTLIFSKIAKSSN